MKTNTFLGLGLDEARYVPAGLHHWRRGDFAPACDSPPLPRMVAALPLLPLDVRVAPYDRGDAAGARERELRNGGRFASSSENFEKYKFFCLARATGFLWWLLGAWVVCRWAGELHGGRAGVLALALWSVAPHVLAFEQRATPDLPLAAVWAATAYAFRRYLRSPSWKNAATSGLLLGAAQLVDFPSLALFAALPLAGLLRRPAGSGVTAAGVGARARLLQAAVAVGVGVWVVNMGYGFSGTGTPLGDFEFSSRRLKGGSPASDGGLAAGRAGNRFRGTLVGRVACPAPADYLRGLDRRLHERDRLPRNHGGREWPAAAARDPLAAAGGRRPFALWGMALWGAALLLAGRGPGGVPASEGLTLVIPVAASLLMATPAVGLVSGDAAVLLTTPFAAVLAGSLAGPRRPGRRAIGWAAALLSTWAVVGGLHAIGVDQVTPENRARFRLDLDKYRRRLGLPAPGEPAAAVTGGHGLLYRTFVDSRGVATNYALFVPRGYRGDRPYPLILFLHGYGDRGVGGRQFTAVGLPFTLAYREIDFLVLCPQGQSGAWAPGGDDARRAMELLAAVGEGYRVDPKRVYLTGLSSGGTGAWDLAAAHPGRWAAIVPVASGPDDPGQAPLIKDVPCWCFHNRYDGGSPAADVRVMIDSLRAAGGRPNYTEYLDVNHGAWDRAYQSPELFEWLARQRLP